MNKVKEILKAAGFENESLDSFLEKWEFFIGECEAGYIWDYSEYRNELRVRYLIQTLIDDQDVANSDSLKYFFDAVNILDQRFKKLLRSDVTVDDGDNW